MRGPLPAYTYPPTHPRIHATTHLVVGVCVVGAGLLERLALGLGAGLQGRACNGGGGWPTTRWRRRQGVTARCNRGGRATRRHQPLPGPRLQRLSSGGLRATRMSRGGASLGDALAAGRCCHALPFQPLTPLTAATPALASRTALRSCCSARCRAAARPARAHDARARTPCLALPRTAAHLDHVVEDGGYERLFRCCVR